MDGIKQQIRARQEESLDKKHTYELKKARREMRAELDRLSTKSKATIEQLKKNYDRQELDEKNQLEIKLTGIRKKNDELVKLEEDKFQKLIADMKLSHEEKVAELEESQQKEIQQTEQEHKEYMETTQTKFDTEKAKFEA